MKLLINIVDTFNFIFVSENTIGKNKKKCFLTNEKEKFMELKRLVI